MTVRNTGQGKNTSALLKAIVGSAPIVLFALDSDGIFTLSQGRALDALGLKPGEVVGKSLYDVYKDYPAIIDACRRTLKGETVTHVVHVQGLAFETRWTPQLDWGGKVTGAIGVATDMTEPYRCILSKDEFLSVISHELRTPLSSASGWAWLLREEELSAAEATKALEIVCRNLEDMKRLISELRDASRAATGTLQLKIKKTDLSSAVRDAAKALSTAAHAKNHTVSLATPSLRGCVDKLRVRQIAWILLSNAIKYSPKGSMIDVRLERREDDALLSVCDQGPGLPQSLRNQVFDLPRIPSAERPAQGRGLGLGLSIARRLVELHGGRLDYSDAAAGGAVFTARLPLTP